MRRSAFQICEYACFWRWLLRRPAVTTFRALTDNDRGAGHGFERAQWLGAGRYARCIGNEIEQIDDVMCALGAWAVHSYRVGGISQGIGDQGHLDVQFGTIGVGRAHAVIEIPFIGLRDNHGRVGSPVQIPLNVASQNGFKAPEFDFINHAFNHAVLIPITTRDY